MIFEQVKDRFKKVRLVRDRETEVFKGTAFVEFEDRPSLEIALQQNGVVRKRSLCFRYWLRVPSVLDSYPLT